MGYVTAGNPTGQRVCLIVGCGKRTVARGWCTGHYQRATKDGERPPPPTIEERFWAKVDRNGPIPSYRPALGPCWLWIGATADNGYGSFALNGRSQQAHRVAYFLIRDAIPPRPLELDHLCRVRRCVNPDHLEPVTRTINTLRGKSLKLSQVGYGV